MDGHTPTYMQKAQIVLSWLLRKIRSKTGRDDGRGVREGSVGGLGKGGRVGGDDQGTQYTYEMGNNTFITVLNK